MARPAGLGRRRVPGLLARGRRRAGLLQADPGSVVRGSGRCLWSLGALPQTLVWDRQAGLHAGGGRPTREFAAFCGQLRVDWHFCEPARPAGQGRRRAPAGLPRAQLRARARRSPTSSTTSSSSTPGSTSARTPRMHKTLRARPIDRLIEERAVMAPLPRDRPTPTGAGCCGSPPDPYLRFDTCDYSLDPRLVGRRVEVRVTEREVLAVALDTRRARLPPRSARSPGTARSPRSSTPAR